MSSNVCGSGHESDRKSVGNVAQVIQRDSKPGYLEQGTVMNIRRVVPDIKSEHLGESSRNAILSVRARLR